MAKIIYATLFALSLLPLPSCRTPPDPGPEECGRGIRDLAVIGPTERAEISFRSGGAKFLAFRGFVIVVPGIDDASLIQRVGYDEIEGTSDYAPTAECHASNVAARRYAELYNRRLVELMRRPVSDPDPT